MTDDTLVVEPETGTKVDTAEPKMFNLEYVQELRQEAASWRTKLREVEQNDKDAEVARLEEQKEWQTLAETRASEVNELTVYKDKYDGMVDSIAQNNVKRVEAVPESMRGLVPDFDDPIKLSGWLDANTQLLAKPTAPSLDGSAGGNERPSDADTLSSDELQYARRMNISAKEYQEAKRG